MSIRFGLAGGGEFVMDEDAIGELLKSPTMVGIVQEAANAVAIELGRRGVKTVWVDTYRTDRQAAAVTIAGYGSGAELVYGLLGDAAESVGLEVHRK